MFRMLKGCGAAALESAESQMRGGGLGLSTARWLNGQAGNEGQDVTSSRGGGERAVGGEEYRIYTWGRSKSGALGHERELEAPHVVEGFPGGPSFYGEQPQLQCGLFHTAALQGGELYTWGRGEGGRLGLGDEVSAHAPQLVEQHEGRWKSVHLGGLHSAAVTEEGALLTWGYGAFGALGYGLWDRRLEPRLVLRVWDGEEVPTPEEPSVDDMPGWLSFLVGGEATAQASKESSGAKVVQASQPFVEVVHAAPAVACGGAHSLFLTREGGLWAAGRDEGEGRLGCLRDQQLLQQKGSPFPRLVLLPEPAAWAVAGGFCSFAMTVDGDLWAWGGNANGELGTGSGCAQHTAPARLEALQRSSIASMAAGGVHAVALDVEGGVWTWGAGQDGQLGRGRLASTALPARVEALRGERIAQVACGSRSSFAVTHDGRLLAWGNNFDGQMACCSRSDRVSEPLQIDGLPPVVSVAAGAAHVAVVCRVEAAAV